MNILGISAWYHDSAAAILVDGKIIAAAQEERFTRKKHDAAFPQQAVRYCLDEAGLTTEDLDAIVFYDKGLMKFERLLETYYSFSPKGIVSFIKAMPVWLDEKIFLKRNLRREIRKIGKLDSQRTKLLFPEHHLSHAASAFYCSPFASAAILTIDGVGEWATASISRGNGNTISIISEMRFPHSVGLLYSAFTYYLGFTVNSGEYKLMGLAPYGNCDAEETKKFEKIIREQLISVKDDGSVWLNPELFTYSTGLRMVDDHKWQALFGFARRNPEEEMKQHHCNLAMAIQVVTEDIVLRMARHAQKVTGEKNICLAGGVALNCVANGRLAQEKIFEGIFVQPASGDAGGALGAALAAWHITYGKEREPEGRRDSMRGSYLGPSFTVPQIEGMIRKRKAVAQPMSIDDVAKLLAEGNVIGWFQGRMEFGPRALGNRSIIGDARNEEMQKKMNLKIKYRESFRPFAPSVLAERMKEYFDLDVDSPYMLMVAPVNAKYRLPVPADYHDLPMMDRLYIRRSQLPAITHVDFSARIHAVHKETNPRFHELITAFEKRTGTAMVVNTSFNVRGEPIVCTPDDAYRCFMRTEMDYLVIGDFLFAKKDQPDWKDSGKWKEEFKPD